MRWTWTRPNLLVGYDILVACGRMIKRNLSLLCFFYCFFFFLKLIHSPAFMNNDHGRSSFELKTREWKYKGYLLEGGGETGWKWKGYGRYLQADRLKSNALIIIREEKYIQIIKKSTRLIFSTIINFKYFESSVHFNCFIPRRFFDIYYIYIK